MQDRIFIITGQVHSGKSSFLGQVTEGLRQAGISLSGFLSVGHFSGRKRTSYCLVSLEDGTKTELARAEAKEGWIPFRRFFFNPLAFVEGERILQEGIREGKQVLVVDEVGPMELEGAGWAPVLDVLVGHHGSIQLWAVRESSLDAVCRHWGLTPEGVITADPEAVETSVHNIIKYAEHNESRQAN